MSATTTDTLVAILAELRGLHRALEQLDAIERRLDDLEARVTAVRGGEAALRHQVAREITTLRRWSTRRPM